MKSKNAGETYFKIISEISPKINNFIVEKIKSKRLPKEFETFLLNLPTKRKDKAIMRSFLTYLIYKNLGGKKNADSLLPLLAISELSNYYAYLDNWIFDNKNNCNKNIKNIKWIIIASAIFRELCQECIEESELSESKKREISKKLLDASSKSYIGQFQDIELTIDKLKNFKSDKDFLEYYQNKSKLASGYFYGLSFEIGAIILGKTKIKDKINSFGIKFGTALHMSNDLGDFGLFLKEDSSFKPYQDQLADLINERLTLPIYFVLKYGDKAEIKSLMNVIKNPKKRDYKIDASKKIVLSGSFHRMMNLLRNYEKPLREEIKTILPKNDYREMIESVISVITTNKYLKDLKKIEKEKSISSKEKIILVDKNNKVLGFEEKMKTHKYGKLHRAVSVLIFNSKGELLLQKRNSLKYHSGGLWSNTACTHPKPNETLKKSAQRRLFEEMGIKANLTKVFSFIYKAQLSKDLWENELDFVFIGKSNEEPEANVKEVEDYKWISLDELKKDIQKFPNNYTSWFKIILQNDYFKNK